MGVRRLGIGMGCGVLAGLLALAASLTSPGRAIEAQTFDWRVAAQRSLPSPDFAIVEINESTLRALAPIAGRWPWPRLFHAGAIDYLVRSRARTIVYDIQFTEADSLGRYRIGDRTITGPDSDAELIASVGRAGNVVLLADVLFTDLENPSASLETGVAPDLPGTTYAPGGSLPERPSIRLPFPDLRNVAAAVGHNLLQKDVGGVSRAMAPFINAHGVAVPSLGMAAVLLSNHVKKEDVRLSNATLRAGGSSAPLREDAQLLLRLRGPYAPSPSGPIPIYSFFDVLLSEENARAGQAPAIPASAFTGKIVFVGTSASGLSDVHATAFGASTPGVYLQASLADNFMTGAFMRRSSRVVDITATVGAGLVVGLILMTLPLWWALSGTAVLAGVATGWATHLVGQGVWVPVVGPWTAALLSAAAALTWQHVVLGREKREIRRLFGKYVSPDIVRQLMTDPSLVRIGGERRNMSVLFSDIRGFTAASERASPEAVVEQLNEYFGEMVDVLFRHQGTLDKFVGDQVMGLFGAPVEDAMHADHAVAAAMDMSAALDRLNARWAAVGRPALEIGIGINSGDMIAGNIGSEAIMSYTVIGDAVNLGSRIESLNKEFGTRILISQATRDALTQPFQTRCVGDATVKGRRERVTVHEVIGRRT